MKNLTIPEGYKPALDLRMTQVAIKKVKDFFERDLAIAMNRASRFDWFPVVTEIGIYGCVNGVLRRVHVSGHSRRILPEPLGRSRLVRYGGPKFKSLGQVCPDKIHIHFFGGIIHLLF